MNPYFFLLASALLRSFASRIESETTRFNRNPYELSFVAVDPTRNDPLTGPYVGYSTIGWNAAGDYGYIGMTGVLREYRGRGLAKALKVAAMRALHAAAHAS